jgi:hypothetical protein
MFAELSPIGTTRTRRDVRSMSAVEAEMQSIAASRWMEDAAGTTSPVVFATDSFGNVYFIEFSRIGTPAWVLDWKSFYHETIAYK